jgi:hypothetical protein
MKFCKIYVLDSAIDIDRIPFSCGDKLPENEQRKKAKHKIEPDNEKPKVLNPLK